MNNTSTLFHLNWADIAKGLVTAVIGAVLTAGYQALSVGGPIDFKAMGTVALLAGLSYIIKNFFSDSQGRVLGAIG